MNLVSSCISIPMTNHPNYPPFSTTIPMAQQNAAVVAKLTRKIKRLEARGGDEDTVEQLREVLNYHLMRT